MDISKDKIVQMIKDAINKGEARGLSGAGIEILLSRIKNKYNLSDEEFKEYEHLANSSINEAKQFYICPDCGDHIDHGEICECKMKKIKTEPEQPKEKDLEDVTPTNKLKKNPGYDIEEKDDERTYPQDESTNIQTFIKQLNTILESSNYRSLYLEFLKDYKSLNESILDPVHKERCPEVFKGDKMLPSVRSFILGIVNDFKKQANFDIEIENIYMIGSSTGYQYTITSDIDIEIETDITDENFRKIFKIIPKGTVLPRTEKPINIFIMKKGEKYDFDKAENVYDVMADTFLKKTEKTNITLPYQYIKDLSVFFMNGCELALNKFNRDVQELKEYLDLDVNTMEISEQEKNEAIDRKLVDLRNDVDTLKMAHHVIFAFEKKGYEGMPFKISIDLPNQSDPRYSINNLVYKMIDKFGYLTRLDDGVKEGNKLIKEVESKYGK